MDKVFKSLKANLNKTLYAVQCILGRHSASLKQLEKKSNNNTKDHNEQYKHSWKFGCFNCEDTNHISRNCSKSLNFKQAAKKRPEHVAKKNCKSSRNHHLVLAYLCTELIEDLTDLFDDTSDENEQSGADIFQNDSQDTEVSAQLTNKTDPECNFHKQALDTCLAGKALYASLSQSNEENGENALSLVHDVTQNDASTEEMTDFKEIRDEGMTINGKTGNELYGACLDTGDQRFAIKQNML